MKTYSIPSTIFADPCNCGSEVVVSPKEVLKRFKVTWKVSADQSDLFAPENRKYDVTLFLDGNRIMKTTYQANPKFHKNVDGYDVWGCFAADATAYGNWPNLECFAIGLCYDMNNTKERKACRECFAGCKKYFNALEKRGINPYDLRNLLEECDDNWDGKGNKPTIKTVKE